MSESPPSAGRHISRRTFLGMLAAGAATAAVGEGVAGAYRFTLERIEATLPGLRSPV